MPEPCNLDQLIDRIIRNVSNDADELILVCGKEGYGKSSVAHLLALAIHKRMLQKDPLTPPFTVENIAFHAGEYIRHTSNMRKKSIAILDEAIRGAGSRAAMSRDNKDLTNHLYINRERNLVQIVCFPDLAGVDAIVKDHRASILIMIHSRGNFSVHIPRRSGFKKKRTTFWHPVFQVKGAPPAYGPVWEKYLERKRTFVKSNRHVGPDYAVEVDRMADKMKIHLNDVIRKSRLSEDRPSGRLKRKVELRRSAFSAAERIKKRFKDLMPEDEGGRE